MAPPCPCSGVHRVAHRLGTQLNMASSHRPLPGRGRLSASQAGSLDCTNKNNNFFLGRLKVVFYQDRMWKDPTSVVWGRWDL